MKRTTPAAKTTAATTISTKNKGTVFFLHGWAQNAVVFSHKTFKLRRKLCNAGYEVTVLEAPNVLPPLVNTKNDAVDGCETNGDAANTGGGGNRSSWGRSNARAWFTYGADSKNIADQDDNGSDDNDSRPGYCSRWHNVGCSSLAGLEDSIALVEESLSALFPSNMEKEKANEEEDPTILKDATSQKREKKNEEHTHPFCAIFGFSQGGSFAHILASIIAAEASKTATSVSSAARSPLRYVRCVICVGAFPATMHPPDLLMAAAAVVPAKTTSGTTEMMEEKRMASRMWLRQREDLEMTAIALPSMHIMGQKDIRVPPIISLDLASQFVDTNNRKVVYYHSKGHMVVQDSAACSAIISFLDDCACDYF